MTHRFVTERARQVFASSVLPRALTVRAATADAPAEILLYDEIGMWGVTAKDFQTAMVSAGAGPLRVRINSPGGDVFDGIAIRSAMQSHPGGVTTVVDGLAASAASFIALAGSSMEMGESAMFMIHNAWGVAVGNKTDMRATADLLDKVDGQIAGMYAAKSGGDLADIASAMDAETWYTAKEATATGYCDAIATPPAKAKNQVETVVVAAVEPPAVEASAAVDLLAVQKMLARIRIALAQE